LLCWNCSSAPERLLVRLGIDTQILN